MAVALQDTGEDPKFIKYLLDPKEEYNCYFLVGNSEISEPQKIGVVKKMLLAHSSVFRRELEESQIKEKGVVRVTDLFPDTFKNMLRYIYGFDNTTTLCFDEADNLFYASEKYMITGLKARTASRLMDLLTPDNICSLMNNPAYYTNLQLNSAITNILQGETSQVLASPQFLDLTGDAFNRILEQEALNVPEIEVWRAALKWAKHKTGSENGQVLRKQLAEQSKHIRICTLSDSELSGEVFPSGVLSGEEVQQVCVTRVTKQKQDGLVNFCNEIQLRQRKLDKPIVKKGPIITVNPIDLISKSPDLLSKSLQIITNNNSVELSRFEFTAKPKDKSKSMMYPCNCTITITRITDLINNTSTETPVTVVFREQVEYNKHFEVPIISNGENVILLPKNKYIINVKFTERHPMYYCDPNSSRYVLNQDFFSIFIDELQREDVHRCHSPMKALSCRILS